MGQLLKTWTVDRLIADRGMFVFRKLRHCSADVRTGNERSPG
jgi:hypothetical protein